MKTQVKLYFKVAKNIPFAFKDTALVEKPDPCQHAPEKDHCFLCGNSGLSREVWHTPYLVRPIALEIVAPS